jgi:hypothetical protein
MIRYKEYKEYLIKKHNQEVVKNTLRQVKISHPPKFYSFFNKIHVNENNHSLFLMFPRVKKEWYYNFVNTNFNYRHGEAPSSHLPRPTKYYQFSIYAIRHDAICRNMIINFCKEYHLLPRGCRNNCYDGTFDKLLLESHYLTLYNDMTLSMDRYPYHISYSPQNEKDLYEILFNWAWKCFVINTNYSMIFFKLKAKWFTFKNNFISWLKKQH